MRALLYFIGFYLFCWLIAASTDLLSRDQLRVFKKSPTLEADDGHPDWLAGNPTAYRISQGTVISEIGGSLDRYDDCTIFDLRNWECTFDDGSAIFGVRDGDFWQIILTPSMSGFSEGVEAISQLEYHIINCRWDAVDGALQFILGCGLRPFFD